MAGKKTTTQGKTQEEKKQENVAQEVGTVAPDVPMTEVPQNGDQRFRGVPSLAVKIDRLYNYADSKVKALVSVNIGNAFAIHGIRVMQSDNGPFVQMPSRSYEKNGEMKYSDLFHPVTAEARLKLNEQILQVYENHVKQQEAQTEDGFALEEEIPEFEEGGVTQSM